jgi:hypothetical protein
LAASPYTAAFPIKETTMKRLLLPLLGAALLLPGAARADEIAEATHAARPGTPGVWQRVEPGEQAVRGLDGKLHSASCSGFPGTDARFSFWVRPGRSRNLAIYFEGGGACWDNTSCSFPVAGLPANVPQFFVPQVPPGTDPAAMDGLFKSDNPANPVRDWDMVYIPYCTGDIHTGSTDKTYTSVGNPALGIPAGTPITLKHRGFDNFMVVMDWVRRHVRHPHKVLVAGSSAGGYGATANSPWVGQLFHDAQLYVLADASQGVTTPGFDSGNPGRNSWNPQWHRRTFGSGDFPGNELMHRAARADRKGRYAQFTTAFDTVQIQFYGAMLQGGYGVPSCPNIPLDWHNKAALQLSADAAELRNYRHYVAAGQYHTLLRSAQFYAEQSAGPVVADWLRDMLQGRGLGQGDGQGNGQGHGQGGHWQNEACPDCLAQLPCS